MSGSQVKHHIFIYIISALQNTSTIHTRCCQQVQLRGLAGELLSVAKRHSYLPMAAQQPIVCAQTTPWLSIGYP